MGGTVFCVGEAGDLVVVVDRVTLALRAAEGAHLDHLAVAPDESEEIALSIVGSAGHDAGVVDALRAVPPIGVFRSQGSHVDHLSAAVEEGMILVIGSDTRADYLSYIVDRVGDGGASAEVADVGHLAAAGEK